MTSTTPVPRRYLNILDRHAGREHSEGGSVAMALAEILNVHTYDVRADLWRERYGVEHPVQAHNPAGLPWWWHACGDVLGSNPQPQVCLDCDDTRPWRPLLVGGDPAPERQPVDHAFKPGPISSGLCAFKEAGSTCGRAEGHHFHHSAPERDPDMEMPEVQAYSRGFTAGHDSTGGDLIGQVMAELGVDRAEDVLITIQKRANALRMTRQGLDLSNQQRSEARAAVERLKAANELLEARCLDAWAHVHALDAVQPDPLVLTLPQVPEGAVALIGKQRWVRGLRFPQKWKLTEGRAPHVLAGLGSVLDTEGSVRVEMAPREPRAWSKLTHDLTNAELPDAVDVETNAGPARWVLVTDDGLYTGPMGGRKTLVELRTIGDVTEVID